jgi:hypothetical protein
MLPYRDSRLTRILVGIFFLIVLGYAYYEARGLLFGPSISISSGVPATAQTSYVLIQGETSHIASLSVDGNPIQVTQTGAFQEPYVLSPGVNRIIFDAEDKYGHTTEKIVEIVYMPSATSSQTMATTTISVMPATSTVETASSSTTIAPTQ